jgi:hypothetical protein
VLACQVEWLVEMLVQKGILSAKEKRGTRRSVKGQVELSKIEIAANERKDPAAETLPEE